MDVTEDGHQMPLNMFKTQDYYLNLNILMLEKTKLAKKMEVTSEFQTFFQLLVVLDYPMLLMEDLFQ